MREIKIEGVISSETLADQWLDDFIDWLESRNEYFGGGTQQITQ